MDRDRLINIIMEMMTTQSTSGAPGFSSKADDDGPVAGYDPIMDLRKKYGRKLNLFYRKRLKDTRDAGNKRRKK